MAVTRSVAAPVLTLTGIARNDTVPSSIEVWSRKYAYAGCDMLYCAPALRVDATTSAPGSLTGRPCRRTALRTLNAAVVMPIPTASDTDATSAKTGFVASRLIACLPSSEIIPERHLCWRARLEVAQPFRAANGGRGQA
jgi:hypothetical protein